MRNTFFIALIIAISGIAVGAVAQNYIGEKKPETPKETVSFGVFFHQEDPMDCGVTKRVEREVPYTVKVADAALRELFNGPTESEKNELNVDSTFETNPSMYAQENIKPLRDYYRGVSIKDSTAIVDFEKDALSYLNSAACMQQSVKSPIIDTLKQFPTIKNVEFSIDGVIWTEWDA